MDEYVILVDKHDNEIGQEEKLIAHQKGLLHRAFSVFIFDDQHRLLLQKRARTKYHSGGLWTNTCCGHPRPGEDITSAAQRRLTEEMGFSCHLTKADSFMYTKKLPNNLIENEIDHIFIATYAANPIPNPEEVEDFKWASTSQILEELEQSPEVFTCWFGRAFTQAMKNRQRKMTEKTYL